METNQVAAVNTASLLRIVEQAEKAMGNTKSIVFNSPENYLHFRVGDGQVEIAALRDGRGIRTVCSADTGAAFCFAIAPAVAKSHFSLGGKKGTTYLTLVDRTLQVAQAPEGGGRSASMQIGVHAYSGEIDAGLEVPDGEGFLLPIGRFTEIARTARACLAPKDKDGKDNSDKARQVNFSLEGDQFWVTGCNGYLGATFKIDVSNPSGKSISAWIPGSVLEDILKAISIENADPEEAARVVLFEGGNSKKLAVIIGSTTYSLVASLVQDPRLLIQKMFSFRAAKNPTIVEVPQAELLGTVKAALSTAGKTEDGAVAICLTGDYRGTLVFQEKGAGSSIQVELGVTASQREDKTLNWFSLHSRKVRPLLEQPILGKTLIFRFSEDGEIAELRRQDQNLEEEFYFLGFARDLHYEAIFKMRSWETVSNA